MQSGTAQGKADRETTMEFTVSKADLVRELNLSQGVVEKKTTIPILSNVLVETAGDRINLTATDLELGIRCSCGLGILGTMAAGLSGHLETQDHVVSPCLMS